MTAHIPTAAEIERKQANAERASRNKQGMQRAVKDVREKITSASGLSRAFELELAREFAQNHVSASLALMPYALVIAGTTLSWSSPAKGMLWLLLVLGVLLYQTMLCRRFLAASTPAMDIKPWIKRLIVGEIAFVTSWALLPTVVGIPDTDVLRVFLLVAVLMIGAVSTVLSHTLPTAVYGAALPLASVIVQLVLDSQPTERWMIAGLCLTALLLFVGLANRLYASTLDNLHARAEKDELFTEVEQANLRLREATRQAEEASAAKSRFLATMSHELRTPLNAILGFSEVMKDELFGPLGNEQYKSYVKDIHQSGEHLLQLINEVLDLSRIEAGKHELVEEAIDLVGVVQACCRMLELRATGRGLMLKTAFTEGMPRLWADERALRQITLNLLSNAIKFTPQGAEILVKVGWTASGGQYLSVRDNGTGIPEEEIEIVLATFGRGSQAIKNADQGSGLGLPIVKSLVELHGGAFRLRSKLREGTEATALFPPDRVMAAMPAVHERPGLIISRVVRDERAA
ncbi:HAMP domain-containing sensor histidine kinase [Rhabdaerophilum sp. SD176]|uniref:sensor histidine kinase n=1 Tax=Rhabdaerophilum sp. SD176 TaxID=2983548 RepID=UPI0024DFDB4F|nr:HAMP domain-containing sensor histidine kinase [Rhabdaerophilum sp. SD176]